MTAAPDRRAHPRLPAMENRTLLEWWDGSAIKHATARVIDVSPVGALIAVEAPPPIDHRVWVRLTEPAATCWVGGRVVRIDDDSVGIAFSGFCHRDFFEAAVQGIGFGNLLGGDGAARG